MYISFKIFKFCMSQEQYIIFIYAKNHVPEQHSLRTTAHRVRLWWRCKQRGWVFINFLWAVYIVSCFDTGSLISRGKYASLSFIWLLNLLQICRTSHKLICPEETIWKGSPGANYHGTLTHIEWRTTRAAIDSGLSTQGRQVAISLYLFNFFAGWCHDMSFFLCAVAQEPKIWRFS